MKRETGITSQQMRGIAELYTVIPEDENNVSDAEQFVDGDEDIKDWFWNICYN